jgi:hypothetical protein
MLARTYSLEEYSLSPAVGPEYVTTPSSVRTRKIRGNKKEERREKRREERGREKKQRKKK